MKQLDEMERMANDYADLTDPKDPYPAETVGDLARALVAVMPVVRAAQAWRDLAIDGDRTSRDDDALERVIDEVQRQLRGGQ